MGAKSELSAELPRTLHKKATSNPKNATTVWPFAMTEFPSSTSIFTRQLRGLNNQPTTLRFTRQLRGAKKTNRHDMIRRLRRRIVSRELLQGAADPISGQKSGLEQQMATEPSGHSDPGVLSVLLDAKRAEYRQSARGPNPRLHTLVGVLLIGGYPFQVLSQGSHPENYHFFFLEGCPIETGFLRVSGC